MEFFFQIFRATLAASGFKIYKNAEIYADSENNKNFSYMLILFVNFEAKKRGPFGNHQRSGLSKLSKLLYFQVCMLQCQSCT
jgi:hypothetical protein